MYLLALASYEMLLTKNVKQRERKGETKRRVLV